MIFTMEASLNAMKQFNTNEERAALFLEMTQALFEAQAEVLDLQQKTSELQKELNDLKAQLTEALNGTVLKRYNEEKECLKEDLKWALEGSCQS